MIQLPTSPAGVRSFKPSRRRFLRQTFAIGAVTLAGIPAARASSQKPRALSFVHTHTGEKLAISYHDGVGYLPPALERINWLLRDFRTGDVHPIDPGVLDQLVDLQALAEPSAPFEVISGYRSPKTNAELHNRSSGVAEHSMHIVGRAIDVRLSGFPTARLHQLALTQRRGGVGFYPHSDFIHLDTGRVRTW